MTEGEGGLGYVRNDGRVTYAGGRMPPLQRFIRVRICFESDRTTIII